MKTCKHQNTVEAYFDGEFQDHAWVEAHLAECSSCSDYYGLLQIVRRGLPRGDSAPRIDEPQFATFMDGISEGIDRQPRNPFRGFWAFSSLVTAALVIVFALSVIFMPANAPVEATEVETVYTEYDGATVDWYPSDDGSMTIWVKTTEDDLE